MVKTAATDCAEVYLLWRSVKRAVHGFTRIRSGRRLRRLYSESGYCAIWPACYNIGDEMYVIQVNAVYRKASKCAEEMLSLFCRLPCQKRILSLLCALAADWPRPSVFCQSFERRRFAQPVSVSFVFGAGRLKRGLSYSTAMMKQLLECDEPFGCGGA